MTGNLGLVDPIKAAMPGADGPRSTNEDLLEFFAKPPAPDKPQSPGPRPRSA
jgi:hypothetical protein